MTKKKYSVLTEDEVQHFISKGYVIVKNCISPDILKEKIDAAWKRLDEDRDDPTTWKKQRVILSVTSSVRISDAYPKAWGAICDLVGGRERIEREEQRSWPDGYMVVFKVAGSKSWSSPIDYPDDTENFGHWHKDHPGNGVKHYLDSREMGLSTYVFWSDIKPRGGGIFVAMDSIGNIARFLKDAPDGVEHEKLLVEHHLGSTEKMIELTGEAGDVALVHPFMIHSDSQNGRPDPRFLIATMIPLIANMNFDRAAGDYSPVEAAVLNRLGLKRLTFKRTGPPAAP